MCREVVNILVVAQRQFPLVLTVQKTKENPQLPFFDKVTDDPVVRVQVLPVVHTPVVCNDICLW